MKFIIALFSLLTVFQVTGQNLEKPFINKLGEPCINSGFAWNGYTVWGSSVIKGDDGKYHMFAARWLNNYPMSSWITDATIVHAISDTPEGPYTFVAEALPPRGEGYWDGSTTYNPVIQKHKDTYILFYTGSHYTNAGDVKKNKYEALGNKRIGIATSKSLNGPWIRRDKPILEPRPGKWDAVITSNAAPYLEEDGSVLLVYKSWSRHATHYYANRKSGEVNQLLGVARADYYLGEYKRIKDEHLFNEYPIPFNSEDPFIWKQDGVYHMLAKIFEEGEQLIGESNAGFHATSKDGIQWTIETSGPAWSRTVNWKEGGSETFERMERPQLLIQNGIPTHIYFAVLYTNRKKEAHSICLPLKTR